MPPSDARSCAGPGDSSEASLSDVLDCVSVRRSSSIAPEIGIDLDLAPPPPPDIHSSRGI